MKLGARLLVGIVGAIVVAGTAAPSHAALAAKCPAIEKTASECKAQSCDKNAVAALALCAELPSLFSKKCPEPVEMQRRHCYQYCDEKYPNQRNPQAESCKED
jgi:hypothetical protein